MCVSSVSTSPSSAMVWSVMVYASVMRNLGLVPNVLSIVPLAQALTPPGNRRSRNSETVAIVDGSGIAVAVEPKSVVANVLIAGPGTAGAVRLMTVMFGSISAEARLGSTHVITVSLAD